MCITIGQRDNCRPISYINPYQLCHRNFIFNNVCMYDHVEEHSHMALTATIETSPRRWCRDSEWPHFTALLSPASLANHINSLTAVAQYAGVVGSRARWSERADLHRNEHQDMYGRESIGSHMCWFLLLEEQLDLITGPHCLSVYWRRPVSLHVNDALVQYWVYII